MALNRVVVLAGGISHERDVSLRSGRQVADSLLGHGLRSSCATRTRTCSQRCATSAPTSSGRRSTARAARMARCAASWSFSASRSSGRTRGPLASRGTSRPRRSWSAVPGVATPRSITLGRDAFRELGADAIFAAIADELPLPLVVKPAQGGSAQGVTIVEDATAMPRAMVDAYTYWDVALVEQRITGTEIAVGVIDTGDGAVALPAVEIEPLSGVYSFEARYNAGETRFYTPARLDDDVLARAAEAALTAHHALGMRHLSRVDMIVDGAGTPWFLEANVLRGSPRRPSCRRRSRRRDTTSGGSTPASRKPPPATDPGGRRGPRERLSRRRDRRRPR